MIDNGKFFASQNATTGWRQDDKLLCEAALDFSVICDIEVVRILFQGSQTVSVRPKHIHFPQHDQESEYAIQRRWFHFLFKANLLRRIAARNTTFSRHRLAIVTLSK